MARRNRLVVNDGVYHVTTRVANRAFLFRDDELKDRIVDWMYGIADFSGVELLSWCVMENHLHLLVHVPSVPRRLWFTGDSPSTSGDSPSTTLNSTGDCPHVPCATVAPAPDPSAFTLRPAECNPPRWSPSGDCPHPAASAWDGPRPRPPVGFMLSDEEMVDRLACLHGYRMAAAKGEEWSRMRSMGRDVEVDVEKERYCRRMYNISQFVKTLKERIAMRYNNGSYRKGGKNYDGSGREPEHSGHLFEGRFYSALVEKTREGLGAVSSYIGVNPVKAGIADSPAAWRWSSFAVASRGEGPRAERCRRAYEKMFDCTWEEAKTLMDQMMSDRLPEGFEPNRDDVSYEVVDGDGTKSRRPLRVTQAIWLKLSAFTRGTIISRDMSFAKRILAQHPRNFPLGGTWSVDYCSKLDWSHVA